ncbi:MAG: type II secretion system F family protein, partial [Desulfohalobiaceae bacterium]
MHYTYTALSQAGTKVNGDIEAESPEEAMDKLANQGLLPRKVKPKSQASLENLSQSLNLMLTRVKAPDLVIFSKQFRTLFHAGIPLTSLLQILEQQTENPRLKKAATDMNQDVQAGKSLTEAFQAHPGIFSQLYCSMIQAGESSGRMTEVLDRLIYLLQHEYKVKSDVKTALRYPILVLVVLFGAFIFLLTFVIPRFIRIFKGAGLELPLPTRISVALYEGLVVYWPVSLAGLAALVLGLYLFLRTETGQYYKDYFLLRIPILGPVFQKAAM